MDVWLEAGLQARLAALEAQQQEVLTALQAQTKAVKSLQQALGDSAKRERRLETAVEAQVRFCCCGAATCADTGMRDQLLAVWAMCCPELYILHAASRSLAKCTPDRLALQVAKLGKAVAKTAAEDRQAMLLQNQNDITGIVSTMSSTVTVRCWRCS